MNLLVHKVLTRFPCKWLNNDKQWNTRGWSQHEKKTSFLDQFFVSIILYDFVVAYDIQFSKQFTLNWISQYVNVQLYIGIMTQWVQHKMSQHTPAAV